MQPRRKVFGTSPAFGQSSHLPSLVNWSNGQAVQPRRSVFGTSPAFGQSSHLPSLVNWCGGQAEQVRASAFGTSPAFGQSSQLPLCVIWVAGHSSAKTIIYLISCTIQGKKLMVYLYSKNSKKGLIDNSGHIIISIYVSLEGFSNRMVL